MGGLRTGAVVVAGALLLGACSGKSSPTKAANKVKTVASTTTSTSTTVAPTTSTTLSVEEQILAAYRAHWDDFIAAAATSDPDSPVLPLHVTAGKLAASRKYFREQRA